MKRIVQPLLRWFQRNARDLPWRHHPTPYRVWISEIMLQQTRVEAVKGYFERFLKAAPDIPSLAALPEERLLKLWEGLGYYSRARNLQKAAKVAVEKYGGRLPASYPELLTLPGIGPYTAGAIASIAFHLPVPAVDGNVLRVWMRLTADSADISDPTVKRCVEAGVQAILPEEHSGDFNQAMMELGATVCVPNAPPKCESCPLAELCAAHTAGGEQQYPVKKPKPPRRIEQRTLFLLQQGGRLALRRRPPRGLLASMWELPSENGALDQRQAVQAVRAMGLEPVRLLPLPPAKHIFTHIEWHMTGWRVLLAPPVSAPDLVWASIEELRERYPLPSAFRPYLNAFLEKTEQSGDTNAYSAQRKQ
ncbi:A/G-specific adenine glycosylase [Caproicibacterium lactatifermentans]